MCKRACDVMLRSRPIKNMSILHGSLGNCISAFRRSLTRPKGSTTLDGRDLATPPPSYPTWHLGPLPRVNPWVAIVGVYGIP